MYPDVARPGYMFPGDLTCPGVNAALASCQTDCKPRNMTTSGLVRRLLRAHGTFCLQNLPRCIIPVDIDNAC